MPLGGQVDHAVAAFLEDVHERGLSDKILLVVTGEMGRSPRRNRDGGRDHYGNLTPLLAGRRRPEDGPGHRPIRQARRHADGERHTPAHLLATVMQSVLDLGEVRAQASLGKTADVVTGGTPIAGLMPG